jgi:DNA adenine methylase
MRSIFRYPGGKTKVADWILAHMPDGTAEYREAFVGGGGVFFALNPSRVARRWINDKNEGLISVYRALAERPEEFIERCRQVAKASPDEPLTEPGENGNGRYPRRLLEEFNRIKLNEDEDPAYRYLFVNRTVFGGRVNYDMPSRLYFSKPEGWDIAHTPRMEAAAEHVRGAAMTCGDYQDVFLAPGNNVWIYADPPYVAEGRLKSSSQLYQHSFQKADHERFAAVVRESSRMGHKIAVSYDDDRAGVVRDLFPESEGFRLIGAKWTYCGVHNAATNKKEVGNELLIINYPLPERAALVAPPGSQIEEESLFGDELTDDELEALDELEGTIANGILGWLRAGQALLAIKDSGKPSKRLYRTLYRTFEEYCLKRWSYQKAYAHRLAAGASVYSNLEKSPIGDFLPPKESHVRELTRLVKPDHQVGVWSNVVHRHKENGEKLTAKLVREEVDLALGTVRDPPPTPYQKAVEAWDRLVRESPEDINTFLEYVREQSLPQH